MYRVLYASLITFVIIVKVQAETCITPNKEQANCISLFSCPILLESLGSKKQESIDFFRNSTCGGTADNPKVCCGSSSSFQNDNTPTESAVDLLASPRICGRQHSDDYHHETDIVLSEAPWLAILKVRYFKPEAQRNSDNVEERGYGCGGALISDRYVLSSTSCIIDERYELKGVLLGEFNIDNTTDCMLDKRLEECSEDVRFYGIEKTITHPAYRSDFKSKGNDVGLIRLNKTVTYTDYIRPICLPLPSIKRAQIGDTLTFHVWDFLRSLLLIEFSPTKSKITLNLETRDYATCFLAIPKPEEKICVRRDVNQKPGPCSLGNNGNPVVFNHRDQWHIEALNGYRLHGGCYEGDSFMVFVNVTYHLNWILENLEP